MERKTKIIFTVTNDLVSDQRMQRICRTLSEEGFDCVLAGRRRKNSRALKQEPFKQKRFNLFFDKGKLFYIEINVRLFFYLLFARYNVICSIDCDTVMPGIWCSRIRGKKLVFDAHELFTEVPEVARRSKVKKIWEGVQKRAFARADMAYTVGPGLAQYFENRYQRPVHCIMNASVLKPSLSSVPSSQKIILYQGALNEGRGIENMIEAMSELDALFVIVGEGYLREELAHLIALHNLEQKVQMRGFVEPDKLPELTAQAYVGLNVSENVSLSYYYSLNNKFFDYIHAGLPSLINDFPEYIALNNKYKVGLITGAGKEPLIQNCRKLLNDESLHLQLQKNCNEAARILNWENESKKLLKLYHNLISE